MVKIKVVLIANPGYGNTVLAELLRDHRGTVNAVFTRRYASSFPYYPLAQLDECCARHSIPCYANLQLSDGEGFRLLAANRPDLILVAGCHQILRTNVIELPSLGIVNLHPSLLPRFRGAVPEQAAILAAETETGVTYHYLTEQIDAGNILLQAKYAIQSRETVSSLRAALADLAASLIPDLIELFSGPTKPIGILQTGVVTFARKIYKDIVPLEDATNIEHVDRMVRALSPHPGVMICADGVNRVVVRSQFMSMSEQPLHDSAAHLDIREHGRVLRLYLRP